jgi:hypothetical protein
VAKAYHSPMREAAAKGIKQSAENAALVAIFGT